MRSEIERAHVRVRLGDGAWLTPEEITYHSPLVEYVRSENAVMRDPSWSFTDANGHVHRWRPLDRRSSDQVALPTLRLHLARAGCDGSCGPGGCDGYPIRLWSCRQCALWVVPGYVPDYVARTHGIPVERESARFEITLRLGAVDLDRGAVDLDRASYPIEIRSDTSDRAVRGTAHVSEGEVYGRFDEQITFVRLHVIPEVTQ